LKCTVALLVTPTECAGTEKERPAETAQAGLAGGVAISVGGLVALLEGGVALSSAVSARLCGPSHTHAAFVDETLVIIVAIAVADSMIALFFVGIALLTVVLARLLRPLDAHATLIHEALVVVRLVLVAFSLCGIALSTRHGYLLLNAPTVGVRETLGPVLGLPALLSGFVRITTADVFHTIVAVNGETPFRICLSETAFGVRILQATIAKTSSEPPVLSADRRPDEKGKSEYQGIGNLHVACFSLLVW